MRGKLTFQSMSHHEMFCSSIGFFEVLESRFGDLVGVEEGWVVVVEFVMVVVIIVFGIIIRVIIMVVVVVVVFFGFICVVLVLVTVLQIQIPHRRSRIKSRRCCFRPCFPAPQIPMIRKRFRNVRGSLRAIGTGCVGFLLIGFVAAAAAAAVQRNSSLVVLDPSSTTHHRAPHVSLLSLIGNFQLTNRNRRAIRNTSEAQSEHRFTFSRAGSRTFLR